MKKRFCGYISIVGKPNVGKSTLLNTILDKKISITSRKSQTTRNNILGVKTDEEFQMIFLDTPGIHLKATKTLNKVLNHSALSVIEDSDLVLFVLLGKVFNSGKTSTGLSLSKKFLKYDIIGTDSSMI